jgi:hypothetical protein
VKVKFRSATRAVIEGVNEGAEVALVNPEQTGAGKAVPPPSAPGGGAVRITVSQ